VPVVVLEVSTSRILGLANVSETETKRHRLIQETRISDQELVLVLVLEHNNPTMGECLVSVETSGGCRIRSSLGSSREWLAFPFIVAKSDAVG